MMDSYPLPLRPMIKTNEQSTPHPPVSYEKDIQQNERRQYSAHLYSHSTLNFVCHSLKHSKMATVFSLNQIGNFFVEYPTPF